MDKTLIGVLIAAVVALFGHYLKQYLENRAARKAELREKQVTIYTELLKATQAMTYDNIMLDDPQSIAEGDVKRRTFASLMIELVAWGTPNIITSFLDLWQTVYRNYVDDSFWINADDITRKYLRTLTALVAAIRKDFTNIDCEDEIYERIAKLYFSILNTPSDRLHEPIDISDSSNVTL